MARPTGTGAGLNLQTTLLLTPKMKDDIEKVAKAAGTSSSEWIRDAIRQKLNKSG